VTKLNPDKELVDQNHTRDRKEKYIRIKASFTKKT
jgi:hypothetical protein